MQVKSVGNGNAESDMVGPLLSCISDELTARRDRWRSIPYIAFQPSHTYSYTICTNKFPSQTWMTEVENGISEWTGNIVRLARTSSNSCADLPTKTFSPFGEIRVADDDDEFHYNCTGGKTMPATVACAGRTPVTGSPAPRFNEPSFIMFRETVLDSVISGGWSPGVDAPNASCSHLYQTAVHEAGHALGLGHATQDVSIMFSGRRRVYCEPRPYDVAAIMALYQSHTAE